MDFLCVSRDVTEELREAVESGDCPRCDISRFDYRTRWYRKDGDYRRLQVIVSLVLAGKKMGIKFDKTLEQKRVVKGRDSNYYRGKMKSVAAMECVLRQAFIKRWQAELKGRKKNFLAVRISSHCLHTLGNPYSHHVPVGFQFVFEGESYAIHREGWDIIETIFGIILEIYQWVTWRLLRRQRGVEKDSGIIIN